MTVTIGHVSIHAKEPEKAADFYRRLLGLEVNMKGRIPPLGDFVFLGVRREDNLPLVAFTSREEARHIAFEVRSLAELKAVYAEAKTKGLAVSHAMNHRVSLSIYFRDPEANLVEVFWPTGRSSEQPYADLMDAASFDRPEAELIDLVSA